MFLQTNVLYKRTLTHIQVRSPAAVCLRLVHCTSWVKRWSKAMDFLQTIFITNILLNILEIYNIKALCQYNGSSKPVSRVLIDLHNSSYIQQSTLLPLGYLNNFGARNVTKFIAKYEPGSRFLIEPIAVTCCS